MTALDSKQPSMPTTPPAPVTHHARMMVFALRDGALVHVGAVPNGKACGCICPECSDDLIARNNGAKRAAHFSHSSGADCASGYETSLHLAGKEALLRLKRLALPEYRQTVSIKASDGSLLSDVARLPAAIGMAEQAWEEVWQEGFRPDVVFQAGDQQLFIEIKVSHAVDEAKLAKIRAKGISAIEIDLSSMDPTLLHSAEAFDDFLTSSHACRNWLFSRKAPQLVEKVRAKLEKRLPAHEAKLQRERLAQEHRRLAQKAKNDHYREAERTRLEACLEQLAISRDASRVAAREQRYDQRNLVPSLESYRQAGIADLFTRVKWHWAFNASFEQWQAYTLDLIFPVDHGQPAEVLPYLVEKWITAKFGVPDFVTLLRHHQAQQAKPRLPPVLTAVELMGIPQTDDAVSEYLEHLHTLGLLKKAERFLKVHYGPRGLATYFVPRGRTIPEAMAAFKVETEQSLRRHLMGEQAIVASGKKPLPAPAVVIESQHSPEAWERILAIRASEAMVFERHKGLAKRCLRCFMSSPAETDVCPYCQAKAFAPKLVVIDRDRISLNHRILASSPCVASSLISAPILDLGSLKLYLDLLQGASES